MKLRTHPGRTSLRLLPVCLPCSDTSPRAPSVLGKSSRGNRKPSAELDHPEPSLLPLQRANPRPGSEQCWAGSSVLRHPSGSGSIRSAGLARQPAAWRTAVLYLVSFLQLHHRADESHPDPPSHQQGALVRQEQKPHSRISACFLHLLSLRGSFCTLVVGASPRFTAGNTEGFKVKESGLNACSVNGERDVGR